MAPLGVAAAKGHFEVVILLIDRGANINAHDKVIKEMHIYIHIRTYIHEYGNFVIVFFLCVYIPFSLK